MRKSKQVKQNLGFYYEIEVSHYPEESWYFVPWEVLLETECKQKWEELFWRMLIKLGSKWDQFLDVQLQKKYVFPQN